MADGISPELQAALDRARAWMATATPEQIEAMQIEQRKSWVRGMTTPCEHGELDFEQCGECRSGRD